MAGNLIFRFGLAVFWLALMLVGSPRYTGTEPFTPIWFVVVFAVVLPILFLDKIQQRLNLQTIKIDPIEKWFPKAFVKLKYIYDVDWTSHTIIPESFKSVPFGLIWVENKSNFDLRVAFVDIRSGAKDLVVSKLENVHWHLRNKKCENLQDVAKVYLSLEEKHLSKTLELHKNVEVVTQ